jgi:hypothetical protein
MMHGQQNIKKYVSLCRSLVKTHTHARFLMACFFELKQFMKSRIFNKIGWNPKNCKLTGSNEHFLVLKIRLRILELEFTIPLINSLWIGETLSKGKYHSSPVGVRWICLCRSSPNFKCAYIPWPSSSELMFFYELNNTDLIVHGLRIVHWYETLFIEGMREITEHLYQHVCYFFKTGTFYTQVGCFICFRWLTDYRVL